jgi:hypothetical protein
LAKAIAEWRLFALCFRLRTFRRRPLRIISNASLSSLTARELRPILSLRTCRHRQH